jgi:chorismate mutase / prephenate dehydratase
VSADLAACRVKIDAIDRELLRLICERQRITLDVVRAKREQGLPVLDSGREEALLQKLTEINPGPLSEEGIRRIWLAIMGESRIYQALSADPGQVPA